MGAETLALVGPAILQGVGGFLRGGSSGQELRPITGVPGGVSGAFTDARSAIRGQLGAAQDLQASDIVVPGSDVSGAMGAARIPGLPSGMVGLFPGFQAANAAERRFPGMPSPGFAGLLGDGGAGAAPPGNGNVPANVSFGETGINDDENTGIDPRDDQGRNPLPIHEGDEVPFDPFGTSPFGGVAAARQPEDRRGDPVSAQERMAALEQTARVIQGLIDLDFDSAATV